MMRYLALLISSFILLAHSAWAISPIGIMIDNSLPATSNTGTAYTIAYTFTNNLPFTINNISITGDTPSNGYTISNNNCSTLTSGGACTYEASFTPENTGVYTVALKFNYAGRQIQLPAQSTTATSSSSSISPSLTLNSDSASVLSYRRASDGTDPSAATGSVTLQNTGSGTLSNITVTDPAARQGLSIDTSNCTTLPAGDSCTVNLSYEPSADPGIGNVINSSTILSVNAEGNNGQAYQDYYSLGLYNAGAQAALQFPNQITDFKSLPPYGELSGLSGNGSGEIIATKSDNTITGQLYISTNSGFFWRPVALSSGVITGVKSAVMESDIIVYVSSATQNEINFIENGTTTDIDVGTTINRLKRIDSTVYALTDNGVYGVTTERAEKVGALTQSVTDITSLNGTLYASGANGVFNVSSGSAVGALADVTSIAAFDGSLYATHNTEISRWNGANWVTVFTGQPGHTPTHLLATSDRIYAGFAVATDNIDAGLSTVYYSTTGNLNDWTATGTGTSGFTTNLGSTITLMDSNSEVLVATNLGVFQYNTAANIWNNYVATIPQSNTPTNHQINKVAGQILMTSDYGLTQYSTSNTNWHYIGGALGGTDINWTNRLSTATSTDAYYVAKNEDIAGEAIYQYTAATGWTSINNTGVAPCSSNGIDDMQFLIPYLYATRLSCADGAILAYDTGTDNWSNITGPVSNITTGKLSLDRDNSRVIGLLSDGVNAFGYSFASPGIISTVSGNLAYNNFDAVYSIAPTVTGATQGAIGIGQHTIVISSADATGTRNTTAVGTTPGSVITNFNNEKLFVYDTGDNTIKQTSTTSNFQNLINTVTATSTGLVHDETNQLLMMDNDGGAFFVKSYIDA